MEKWKRKQILRLLSGLCVLLAGGYFLMQGLAVWILRMSVSDAASVGIIGGADGPTAIFVTSTPAPEWYGLGMLVLLAVGIWGIISTGKKNP